MFVGWLRLRLRHVLRKLATLTVGALHVSPPASRWRARRDRAAPLPRTRFRVALVAHVHYPEMLAAIIDCHGRLPEGSPLFVTTTPEASAPVQAALSSHRAATIYPRPNRGRDIAPFVHLLSRGVLSDIDVVLKLHTKKSRHLIDGRIRGKLLLDRLAGSRKLVQQVLDLFDDPRTGMVGWQHAWSDHESYWFANRATTVELLGRMGIAADSAPRFFEGSMFWVRVDALRRLSRLALRDDDFPDEIGQLDGALHHAVERVFVAAAAAEGFETRSSAGRLLLPARPLSGLSQH